MVFSRDKMNAIQGGGTPGTSTYKNPAALHENLYSSPDGGGDYSFGEQHGKDLNQSGGFLTFDVEGYEGSGQTEEYYHAEMMAAPKTTLKKCCFVVFIALVGLLVVLQQDMMHLSKGRQPATIEPATIDRHTHRLTLDRAFPEGEAELEEFKDEFKTQVAEETLLEKADVDIVSVEAGSVVVEFHLIADPAAETIALETLKSSTGSTIAGGTVVLFEDNVLPPPPPPPPPVEEPAIPTAEPTAGPATGPAAEPQAPEPTAEPTAEPAAEPAAAEPAAEPPAMEPKDANVRGLAYCLDRLVRSSGVGG